MQADIEKVQRERFSLSNSLDWLGKTFGVSAFNPAFATASFVLLITLGITIGITKYISTENSSKENASNKETISQKTDVQSLPEKTIDNAENEVSMNDKKDKVGKSEVKTTMAQVANRVKRNVSRSDSSKLTNQFPNSKFVNPNRRLTNDEIVEKAERQYKGAIAILSSDIKRRRAQMPPNFISRFEQPLADIDRTINETRRAVRAQPNDAVVIQYMTTAYAKKIELLRAIAGN